MSKLKTDKAFELERKLHEKFKDRPTIIEGDGATEFRAVKYKKMKKAISKLKK